MQSSYSLFLANLQLRIADTADVSDFEVGLLAKVWKAKHAVRDDALVWKLCDSLKYTLGNGALSAYSEKALLAKFSPQLECDDGDENIEWSTNANEAQESFPKDPMLSGLTPFTESVVVKHGYLPSRTQVFVRIWSRSPSLQG